MLPSFLKQIEEFLLGPDDVWETVQQGVYTSGQGCTESWWIEKNQDGKERAFTFNSHDDISPQPVPVQHIRALISHAKDIAAQKGRS